jgi:hypothetical protein
LESSIYAELEQRVETTNFELKAAHSGADMENYINDALDGADSGRVALLLRASYLSTLGVKSSRHQDAWTAFNAVLEVRRAQFDELLNEWARLMDTAVWLHHQPANKSCSILMDYVAGIQNNSLGDLDVTTHCQSIAGIAIGQYHPQNFGYVIDDHRAALRNVRIELSNIAQKLIDYKRPLRFFESIRAIEEGWAESKGYSECDCCGDAYDEAGDWMILSSCGHLLCSATCSQHQEGNCPVKGCNSHYKSHQMIPGNRLAGAFLKISHSSGGGKLSAIAHLINDEIPEDDQVLVFVQSIKLRQKVVDVLKEHKISYTDLKSTGKLATQLTKFQHSRGRRDKDKVLILNIGDASASGR